MTGQNPLMSNFVNQLVLLGILWEIWVMVTNRNRNDWKIPWFLKLTSKQFTAPKSWKLIAYCTSCWQPKSLKMFFSSYLVGLSILKVASLLSASFQQLVLSLKFNFSESSLLLRLFTQEQRNLVSLVSFRAFWVFT